MKRKLKTGRNIDRDVVLCKTYNFHAGRSLCRCLIEASIPFKKEIRHIPFFMRESHNGNDEICIISINRNQYHNARKTLDGLDRKYKDRLLINPL